MILFVVNDAGPAKYLAHIMALMDCSVFDCIASEVSAQVFNDFFIEYAVGDETVKVGKYNLIVTGTHHGSGIDQKWISIGLNNNIKTITIIEHWSLYQKRFEANGNYVYPDLILVNDAQAKYEAQADGIPEHKLHIMGNPVLENVTKHSYSSDEEIDWRNALEIGHGRKIITFISESLKEDFPKDSPEYEGFDEFEVLNDIYRVIDLESTLLIKIHPSEDSDKYNFIKIKPNVSVIKNTDISKLIEFSSVLIGMGSMLLIEASLIKNNVYSYRPNEKNTFIGNRNGTIKKINDIEELREKLVYLARENVTSVSKMFDGSTKKIVTLLESYL